MSTLLPFIVIGLVSGSVYGLAATGLVLTYKTSGIFNFAHGSVAALAVFAFYFLHVQHGVAWPLAAAISVLVLGPVMGLLLERLARLLADVSDTQKIASTIGIVLLVLGLGQIWFPTAPQVPSYLPTDTVRFLGVNVGYDQITVIAVSLVATGILYYFFRFVRLGVAMRGVVDDPDLLAMNAQNPNLVRRWAWIIGAVFASMSGILLAPSLNLDATVLTLLVVQAFGAAAIGYFSSLPLTYLGGVVIGVLGAVSTKYVTQVPSLAGLPPSLPFIVLFIVLIVTPRARLATRRFIPSRAMPESWYAPLRPRLAFAALFLVLLCAIPGFAGSNLPVYSAALVDVILFLSLGLLIRNAGQVSLCQYAFAAVGAAAMAHFTTQMGIPWLVAILLAGLVAIPVGAVVAVPAIRLTGVFLALATLGFGILMSNMFYTENWMFGPTTNGIAAKRPHLGALPVGSDRGFYYVILAFTVAAVALVMFIKEGRLGRLLRAMSDSPLALETHGTTVNVARVLVFCISSFLAAISGALTASLFHFAVGSEFGSFNSLTLVALLVIIVAGSPWYAVIAAFNLEILPSYINLGNITVYLSMLFGVSAMVFPALTPHMKHIGMPIGIRRAVERLDRLMGGGRDAAPQALPLAAAAVGVAGAVSELGVVGPADGGPPSGTNGGREHVRGTSRSAGLRGVEAPHRPVTVHASSSRPRGAGPQGAGVATAARVGLEVRSLSVHYGGAAAVLDFSLKAPTGRITGLIGPNGAGKTTTFNACCGLLKPTAGEIWLHGEDVSREGPAARARRGLGRTFQRVELFNSLPVIDNVAMGREAMLAGRNPLRHLLTRRGERVVVDQAVREAIELTGIAPIQGRAVSDISTGQRRLVELARVLAGPFDLILLDEPSSGLDQSETERFGRILTRVVGERGIGLLVVEHDMSLVRQVCDMVYVLDFGRHIFEGPPADMLRSEVVRAAYLGSEGVTEAVSSLEELATSTEETASS